MHMADALLSPLVGGTMWAASAGAIAYSSRKVGSDLDDRKVPLMGVLGAFIFAAQMVNFSIPGTGSSGHLGGALLLSVLLGPHAALLTIASVLVVQALFFADGGLLALGCNIFNVGVIPAWIVYPLVYRRIAGTAPGTARARTATMAAALVALQLGPLAVVLQTWLSGVAALPVQTFLLLMQPIHLAIGTVEGVVTIAILSFVHKARPELMAPPPLREAAPPLRPLLACGIVLALLTGGILSSFASKSPDGLEWAIAGAAGGEIRGATDRPLTRALGTLQQRTAILPDYDFRADGSGSGSHPGEGAPAAHPLGTNVAGIVGSLATLLFAVVAGFLLKRKGSAALS